MGMTVTGVRVAVAIQNPLRAILRHTMPLHKVPYEEQLEMKTRRTEGVLQKFVSLLRKKSRTQSEAFYKNVERFGGLPCEVEPIRFSNKTIGFRNKNTASFGYDVTGELALGHSFRFKSRKYCIDRQVVVPCAGFPGTSVHHSKIFEICQAFGRRSKFQDPTGDLMMPPWRELLVRSNRKEECLVHVALMSEDPAVIQEAKAELLTDLLPNLRSSVNLKSFYWMVGKSAGESVLHFPSELLWGDRYLEEQLFGKRFLISPRSFFQVNTAAAELLYSAARELLATTRRTLLLDICCGTGTIGIILSDAVAKVIGVDINPSAIHDAKLNSELNKVTNIEHHCEDAEDFLAQLGDSGRLRAFDHVVAVVNPHRTGLTTRLMRKLRATAGLKQVVYLSCQPEGRPCGNFVKLAEVTNTRKSLEPFLLTKVIPIDPFPHTRYVELVLNFER